MSFPITASGFSNNVGAITLFIQIDTNVMAYAGNTPGTVTGYYIFYDNSTGTVGVSKTSIAPLSINGVMLTLSFNYTGGSGAVEFAPGCEFATTTLVNIPFSSTNGSAGPVPRTDYYVDAAVPSSGSGLSWATAFKTITEATNAALDRGDHVTIKPGTYNEALVIKSNGTELVPLKTGVNVTDSNTVFFPSGTSLDCIDPESYPDEIFLYLYRSLKGNNGVYEVLHVDAATRMVTVKGANFVAEAGSVGDTARLQASIAHSIVYRKDTTNTNPVIVNASSSLGARAVCYVGTPADATGESVTASANYNIIDGIDLTGMNSTASRGYGLRIQGSSYNVFMRGKIYECDSVGVYIHGINAFPAKRNIVCDNSIYNIKRKGLKLGNELQTAANNRVHQNIFLRNEVYSTGAGANRGFYTMAETNQYTSHNIIEGNTFRNFSFQVGGRGAIQIGSNSSYNVVLSNFLKDITDALAVTNAFIYVRNNASFTRVFNNVLLMSSAVNDDIYAFRLNSQGHSGTRVVYNTVYNLDKGVLFEDPAVPVFDFSFRNNILNTLHDFYFTHTGNVGRFTVGNNCYSVTPTQSGGTAYSPGSTSSIVANPLFLDPTFFSSPYGFTLKTGSPCIAAGTPITDLVVDLEYDGRDATNPSIGAFENILTQTSWTGKVNSNWHDYRNWNPEIYPNSALIAIIPNKTNDPIVTNSNASCKSIELQQSATVHVNSPYTLTIVN